MTPDDPDQMRTLKRKLPTDETGASPNKAAEENDEAMKDKIAQLEKKAAALKLELEDLANINALLKSQAGWKKLEAQLETLFTSTEGDLPFSELWQAFEECYEKDMNYANNMILAAFHVLRAHGKSPDKISSDAFAEVNVMFRDFCARSLAGEDGVLEEHLLAIRGKKVTKE